jgi:hypothetical protein
VPVAIKGTVCVDADLDKKTTIKYIHFYHKKKNVWLTWGLTKLGPELQEDFVNAVMKNAKILHAEIRF